MGAGFMDVVSLEKTNQHFRLLYDTKGRFVIHQIHKEEAAYKLCRVMSHEFGPGGNQYITTHDGRTIRFPDPDVKAHDTVLVNLDSGKIENKCKFEVGAMCMIKGGNNTGRVGVITTREKHPGSYEIITSRTVRVILSALASPTSWSSGREVTRGSLFPRERASSSLISKTARSGCRSNERTACGC